MSENQNYPTDISKICPYLISSLQNHFKKYGKEPFALSCTLGLIKHQNS